MNKETEDELKLLWANSGANLTSMAIRNIMNTLRELDGSLNSVDKLATFYPYVETENILQNLSNELNKSIEIPVTDRISTIKSQLKHCKSPLQKLNLEREMNKLIRERKEK